MRYSYFKPHDYDKSQTITSLLAASMNKHKDRTAVVYNERSLTYGELDRLTGKIARFLKEHGAAREKVVAILLPRSEMMVVAAIGAIKSGAAYQPLDPTYPDDRLAFMVEDSEAMILITEKSLRDRLPKFNGTVLDISEIESLPDWTEGQVDVRPKGVMLGHRNLVAFITLKKALSDSMSCFANGLPILRSDNLWENWETSLKNPLLPVI